MIHLQLLNGKAAGRELTACRFPVRIGRAADAHLRLVEQGVWERHAEIHLHHSREFVIAAHGQASLLVNSQAVQQTVLHPGDLLDLGGARLRFQLSAPTPRSLKLRETVTWIGLGLVFVVQLALIYWLVN